MSSFLAGGGHAGLGIGFGFGFGFDFAQQTTSNESPKLLRVTLRGCAAFSSCAWSSRCPMQRSLDLGHLNKDTATPSSG